MFLCHKNDVAPVPGTILGGGERRVRGSDKIYLRYIYYLLGTTTPAATLPAHLQPSTPLPFAQQATLLSHPRPRFVAKLRSVSLAMPIRRWRRRRRQWCLQWLSLSPPPPNVQPTTTTTTTPPPLPSPIPTSTLSIHSRQNRRRRRRRLRRNI